MPTAAVGVTESRVIVRRPVWTTVNGCADVPRTLSVPVSVSVMVGATGGDGGTTVSDEHAAAASAAATIIATAYFIPRCGPLEQIITRRCGSVAAPRETARARAACVRMPV